MEILESLKAVFENSDEKIIIVDNKMNVIWKNKDDLPDYIDVTKIKLKGGSEFTLPLENAETAEYESKFGKSSAVKIEPLREQEDIIGYLLHIFSCEDIELISDRSGYRKFKTNFLGNIRIEMAAIVNLLDTLKQNEAIKETEQFAEFDRAARYHVLKTFSATVNMSELSKYYSGFFSTDFVNISKMLKETAQSVSQLLAENGCDFSEDIDNAVYLDINADRLKIAVTNLIVNAFMYNSKKEKQCRLSLKSGNEIVITVSDNGDGMDEQTQLEAVQPFGSFHEYSQNESLGLALVKLCCDNFGGRLEIDSELGVGTYVRLIFPKPEKDIPNELRSNGFPLFPSPYDSVNCILAKAFNPMKK